jgi:hypothetical protein
VRLGEETRDDAERWAYGRFEAFNRGTWSAACGGFTPDSAQATCKMMGFSGGARLEFPGQRSDKKRVLSDVPIPVTLAAVDCSGNESSILDCETLGTDQRTCPTPLDGDQGIQKVVVACADVKGAFYICAEYGIIFYTYT